MNDALIESLRRAVVAAPDDLTCGCIWQSCWSAPAAVTMPSRLLSEGVRQLPASGDDQGLVDEFWFWVNPHLWPAGPRILDGVGPIRLQLVAATPYRSGVVWPRYRPAGA